MPPLPLHEVLEQEYVSMYGPLELPKKEDGSQPTAAERLENVIDAIHKRGDRTALCISGGGIRSATFALGVVQGFARAGLLKKFDYLSTVSGGGYVGSWLSSWIRRDREGVEGVEKALASADTAVIESTLVRRDEDKAAPAPALPASKLDPEPRPLRHLREYSNYLSPRMGILSGDSWTVAAIYIRNLLLNLLVLVPLLAAVLAIPRLFSWALKEQHALPAIAFPWFFAIFAAAGFAYLGRTRPVEYGMADEKKRVLNADGRFLVWCVLPLTLAAAALAIAWARHQTSAYDVTSLGFVSAVVVAVAGMTLVPYFLYYSRLKSAAVAARRAGFAVDSAFRAHVRRKAALEGVATFVALVTSLALYGLLALKVFDDPLRATPQLAKLPPLLRFFVPATPQAQLYVCLAVPLVLLVFFVQASIFVGLSSRKNEDADREWWARAGAWLLLTAVAVAVLNLIAVFGPVALYYAPMILSATGGVAGIAAAMLGYSDKTPANQKRQEQAGPTAKAGNIASALAVPLFVVFLLAAISFGSTWIIQQFGPDPSPVWNAAASMQSEVTYTADAGAMESKIRHSAALSSLPALKAAAHLETIQETTGLQLLIFLAVALVAVGLSFMIGVNKFSMNAVYRNRLIRAYLGASRFNRQPEPFTGFDEDDNLPMWTLRQELLWTTSIRDLHGFVQALKDEGHVWSRLDQKTRDMFDVQPYHRRARETLVVSLNHLILTGDLRTDCGEVPEWIKTKEGTVGYSDAVRNRAILDHRFSRWLRMMPAPARCTRVMPEGAVADQRAPMQVINMALNLTTGDNLAWQQRMAESFTVSPLHAGSARLGYRNARHYGGARGISVGTAVSISGAAASPNMGYHSSPVVAFLLTFFNIRLGAWLGNPGEAGEASYEKAHPTTNLIPFAKEATGSSNSSSKWVYLSDGGHFENLGLYEMVLRRCRRIVVSDGGCDPAYSFEDLGNAIRKIRTDLGIPIDIYDMKMEPRGAKGEFGEGRFVAQAHIRYSAIDRDAPDGTLIYIKAGVYKDEDLPGDIYNYAKESLLFPHESTGDQFFSESQFESYRALGRYAVNELCADRNKPRSPTMRIPIAKKYEDVEKLFSDATTEAEKRRQTPAGTATSA